jgi:isoprenylcysteine carboxyl methyltransferase (ICMT) family protein YpbQ
MAFGAWPAALGFSVINAALLARRIQVEEAALRNGSFCRHPRA